MPRKQHKYHYIYKTTCIVTKKYYIGMHSTSNLEDEYMGSGKILRYSLNKHGKENHIKEILEFLPSKELLKIREREIVNEELLKDPLCINLVYGGNGSWEFLNRNSDIQRNKGKKGNVKIKWLKENDKEWAEKTSKNRSLALSKSYETGNRKIITPNWTGKKHKIETIEKLKGHKRQLGKNNSQFGTCWIYNIQLKEKKRIKKEELTKWIEAGWKKGAIFNWDKHI